jgi:hypothetical protein
MSGAAANGLYTSHPAARRADPPRVRARQRGHVRPGNKGHAPRVRQHPAFDTRFCRRFRAAAFDPKAFRRIGEFYQEHARIIERHRIRTLDFGTGKPTHCQYSRAKVIDMIFFIEGGRLRTSPES